MHKIVTVRDCLAAKTRKQGTGVCVRVQLIPAPLQEIVGKNTNTQWEHRNPYYKGSRREEKNGRLTRTRTRGATPHAHGACCESAECDENEVGLLPRPRVSCKSAEKQ